MSKELIAAKAVLTNNAIDFNGMTDSQILTIANAMATANANAQLETLSKALKDGRKGLNDKIGELKLTPVQKAIKKAKEQAKDNLDGLAKQVDEIRQAQAAATGEKIGNKLADTLETVDQKVTAHVPGVSAAKGFFRGITGAFRS